MGRLIDADALFKAYENIEWYNNADRDEIAEKILLEQPTVEVVEIVRCKDCKYWRDDDCKNDNHGYCPINENDFCPWGERRKDETDRC